nr:hypothetical protein [Tanacetum cinerariifolium]
MGDEHLDTIMKTESDEVIKSSVENLVPIPSESKGISDDTCDVLFCDNSHHLGVLNDHFELFFNFNDDCTSYDGFSPINVFEEESDIECKDSYDSNLDESTFLVTPLSDSNEDEYFTRVDDVELLLDHDPSTPMMSVVSILEGFTDEPPLEENNYLFDLETKKNDWKKILYDAPIDDLMTEDKTFDPEIHDQIFSLTYVSLPFEGCHYLFFTYVVRIYLSHFTYLVVSLFLLSSGSEDTIFDPGISTFYFSHRSETFICFNVYLKALNESSMEICSSTCFYPNIKMIKEIPYGEIKVHIEVLSVLWGTKLPTRMARHRCLEIPSGEIKVHIEVLSVLWGNRLPIRMVHYRCL